MNRIAAIPDASRLKTSTGTGTTIFAGTPLNVPGGIAINPFNNDVLVVNLNDNNLVEINPANATVVGVKAIDPLVEDAMGNNAALFGVTATVDKKGDLLIFFTDDNTNTLNALSAAPLTKSPLRFDGPGVEVRHATAPLDPARDRISESYRRRR